MWLFVWCPYIWPGSGIGLTYGNTAVAPIIKNINTLLELLQSCQIYNKLIIKLNDSNKYTKSSQDDLHKLADQAADSEIKFPVSSSIWNMYLVIIKSYSVKYNEKHIHGNVQQLYHK